MLCATSSILWLFFFLNSFFSHYFRVRNDFECFDKFNKPIVDTCYLACLNCMEESSDVRTYGLLPLLTHSLKSFSHFHFNNFHTNFDLYAIPIWYHISKIHILIYLILEMILTLWYMYVKTNYKQWKSFRVY